MPRVLFLTWSESQPSTRYRVHGYVDGLRRDGFDVEILPASGLTLGKRINLLRRARGADVVYVQKKLFNPAFLPALAAANSNIAFDFDDAGFAREPYNPRPRGMAPGSPSAVRRLRAVLKRARAVVAGNSFLASYARDYNRVVHVLPTPVDTDGVTPRRSLPGAGRLRIGWLGTSKNLYYLRTVAPALKRVHDKLESVELSVLSNAPFEMDGMPVHNISWSERAEPQWLSSIDVGIMPLEHDDWSRGKCAFKLLQYMAAGLPTVSTPAGMNSEVVEDGVNGMLADSEDEWVEKLLTLLGDAGLRAELGARGRSTVVDGYSLRPCLRKLEDIIGSLVH